MLITSVRAINEGCPTLRGWFLKRGQFFALFFSSSGTPGYNPAITSISTSASLGRRATCTVERAGGADVK